MKVAFKLAEIKFLRSVKGGHMDRFHKNDTREALDIFVDWMKIGFRMQHLPIVMLHTNVPKDRRSVGRPGRDNNGSWHR